MTGGADSMKMKLFHVGFYILEDPDIYYGKKNADFGQGFYLSDNEDFSHRWAKLKKDRNTYINSYELDLTGLKVKRFERSGEWFGYIFDNRRFKPDALSEYDVIIGPIANDTIYNVMGVTTSGFLKDEDALKLLQVGPAYTQIAIKSVHAKEQLKWLGYEQLHEDEISGYRAILTEEEKNFQILFGEKLSQIEE